MTFDVTQEPKHRWYWEWPWKKWVKVTHKVKKPKCSFCGYKFKKEEIGQKPTISLGEQKQLLKERVMKHANVQRKKPKYHG